MSAFLDWHWLLIVYVLAAAAVAFFGPLYLFHCWYEQIDGGRRARYNDYPGAGLSLKEGLAFALVIVAMNVIGALLLVPVIVIAT
jgi:hypothetical protein